MIIGTLLTAEGKQGVTHLITHITEEGNYYLTEYFPFMGGLTADSNTTILTLEDIKSQFTIAEADNMQAYFHAMGYRAGKGWQ